MNFDRKTSQQSQELIRGKETMVRDLGPGDQRGRLSRVTTYIRGSILILLFEAIRLVLGVTVVVIIHLITFYIVHRFGLESSIIYRLTTSAWHAIHYTATVLACIYVVFIILKLLTQLVRLMSILKRAS